MGHNITALVLKGKFDENKAQEFDLQPVDLGFGLTMFYVDFYYAAYWQHILPVEGYLDIHNPQQRFVPSEKSLYAVLKAISRAKILEFALINTDYFAGIGAQFANVFREEQNADKNILYINEALRYLGVQKKGNLDEFDTVALSNYRSNPDELGEKYSQLCDDLNL